MNDMREMNPATGINGVRGEVGLDINGVQHRLCLTLGALAEIETTFGCTSISALQARLKNLSASELMSLLAILLRAGGTRVDNLSGADLSPGAAARAVAAAFHAALG